MTCPTGKRQFFGQVAADKALTKIQKSNPDGPSRSYRCDVCGTWHVTRESGAKRKHRGAWQTKRGESMRGRRYW